MGVTRQSSGQLLWSGTDLSVWALGTTSGTAYPLPASCFVDIQCFDVDDHIRLLAPASSGYNTGWSIGVFDDTGTLKLCIRRKTLGDYESFGDVTAASRSDTVGISAGDPYTLRVTFENETITAQVFTAAGVDAEVIYDNSTDPTYIQYTGMGVETEVNGARCIPGPLTPLVERSDRVENVVAAVSNGTLYASFGRAGWNTIAERIMPTTGFVSMWVNLAGEVMTLGGNRIFKSNLVTRDTVPHTASAGSLPGQTDPGSTTATIGLQRGDTTVLIDGRFLYVSAEGDDQDWDTGSDLVGHAYALTLEEPIRAAVVTSLNTMIVSLVNSYKVVSGSEILANIEIRETGADIGASGPASMLRTLDGLTMTHTASGLMRIPDAGGAANLSANILRTYVSFDPEVRADRTYIVGRNPQSQETYLFRTVGDGVTQSPHVVYDEPRGRFLIDTYPVEMEPTAVCVADGRLLLGCYDGGVRAFSEFHYDDDGEPIESMAFHAIIGTGSEVGGVKLDDLIVKPSRNGFGVVATVYGSRDVAGMFDQDARRQLMQTTFERGFGFCPIGVTDRVLGVLVTPQYSSSHWGVAAAQGKVTMVSNFVRDDFETPVLAGRPCTPPGAIIPVDPGDDDDDGGDGPPPPPPPPPPVDGQIIGTDSTPVVILVDELVDGSPTSALHAELIAAGEES